MTANGACDQKTHLHIKCGRLAHIWSEGRGWDCGEHIPTVDTSTSLTMQSAGKPLTAGMNRAERRKFAKGAKGRQYIAKRSS